MLGKNYDELISPETGEWQNDEVVLNQFYNLFETRIQQIFANTQEIVGIDSPAEESPQREEEGIDGLKSAD